MKARVYFLILFALSFFAQDAFAQSDEQSSSQDATPDYNYRVSLPTIIVPQLWQKSWDDRTHTQHIELHVKRNLDNKNIVGVKLASWQLFQPMGIVWWDGLLDKVESGSEYYPGHVRHTGVGFSYQRMLWKGLFASVEILPMVTNYLDEDREKVATGFKLYNSVHLGYHQAFGKKRRFFVEPQVHSQHWGLLDTNTPAEFAAVEDKWRTYFLFEPNLYVGFKF